MELKRQILLTKRLDGEWWKEYDVNGQGFTKLDYLIANLVHLGVVDMKKDIQPWLDVCIS